MIADYVGRLHAVGRDQEGERLIREAMKRRWNDDLVWWFGMVRSQNAQGQLKLGERWLTDQPRNPVLLLTLARICCRNRLWGKARSYLEASLGGKPMAETYRELGDLLEQMGERDKAAEAYRDGLKLALDNHDATQGKDGTRPPALTWRKPQNNISTDQATVPRLVQSIEDASIHSRHKS